MAGPLFVLIHSPLVGPYSWIPVSEGLRARGQRVVIPRLRSLESKGQPYWKSHVEAVTRAVDNESPEKVILVSHSGAGRLLPVCGQDVSAQVASYVFVDSDIPVRTESRLDAMPIDLAQQFRDAAEDGLLPPWPEEVFKQEILDDEVRKRLVSELSPLPLAVYEEAIPLPEKWPDADCVYMRLSDKYPKAEQHAEREGWRIYRFNGDHFLIVVAPEEIAAALLEIVGE